jgi:predicted naringenin-chalcone synthase
MQGGAKVLANVEKSMQMRPYYDVRALPSTATDMPPLKHSWESMADYGNCSSVSVIDVLRRCMDDADHTKGHGLLAAVG